jgi:GTPase SAR1 family protein
MRTVKLVLIGPSGVGKTALRGKVEFFLFLRGHPDHTHTAHSTSLAAFLAAIGQQ